MKDFIANNKVYILNPHLRDTIRPNWQEMLKPAKGRLGKNTSIFPQIPAIIKAEDILNEHGETFVGKDILEVGCNEGIRSYVLAKYQDAYVHGIDVDDYTVDQSPDLNIWNPEDGKYVHNLFDDLHKEIGKKFPLKVSEKVTFETCDISKFYPSNGLYDMIVSWDTLEHIIDIKKAFEVMSKCLFTGGIMYHQYNPFFSITGGHSLCTLDFPYGHCRLSKEDFEKYIREYRPDEEKVDLNFYNKCLNRATIADIKEYAEASGFEVLSLSGTPAGKIELTEDLVEDITTLYPKVTMEDLMWDFIDIILRKK